MGLIQTVSGNIVPSLVDPGGTLGSIVQSAGQVALSAAAPDEYEAYAITFQLLKSFGGSEMIQSITFPVMPESLVMAQKYLMTVTTTLGGNYVDDFGRAPSPITLSGTFGRKIRPIISAGSFSGLNGASNIARSIGGSLLASDTSTGYGMVKRLSNLVEASHTIQADGAIPKLIFFNWAFNSHWEVVVDSFDVRMDVQQNNLWFYQLSMRALKEVKLTLAGAVDGLVTSAVQSLAGNLLDSKVGAIASTAASVINNVRLSL